MMPKGRKTLPLNYHIILKSAEKRYFGENKKISFSQNLLIKIDYENRSALIPVK